MSLRSRKWKGEVWDAEGKVVAEAEGKIKIPDLSEETYDDLRRAFSTTRPRQASAQGGDAHDRMQKHSARGMAFVKELKASIASGGGDAPAKSAAIQKDTTAKMALNTYVTSKAENAKTAAIKFKYSLRRRCRSSTTRCWIPIGYEEPRRATRR